MIARRGFMTAIAALAGVGTAGAADEPVIDSTDWSLTCESGVCAVTVSGRVQPASERRDVRARIQLSEDCVRTVTDVVQPESQTYAVTLLTTHDELREDTIEIVDVEVGQ